MFYIILFYLIWTESNLCVEFVFFCRRRDCVLFIVVIAAESIIIILTTTTDGRRTTTTDGRDGRTEDDDDDGTDDGRTQDRTEDDDDDGTDDGRRRRATDDGRRRRTDGLHFSLILNILIDIGTKILKQKCFGSKTNVFNTHSNFPPAIEFQISCSIRISYSRGCRSFFLIFSYFSDFFLYHSDMFQTCFRHI